MVVYFGRFYFHMSEKRLGTPDASSWSEYARLAEEGRQKAAAADLRRRQEALQARREAAALKKKRAAHKPADFEDIANTNPSLDSAQAVGTEELESADDEVTEVMEDDEHPLPSKITGSKTSMFFGPGVDEETHRTRRRRGPDNQTKRSTVFLPGYNTYGDYVSTDSIRSAKHKARKGERKIRSTDDNAKPRSQEVRRGPSIRDIETLPLQQRKKQLTTALAEIQEEREREEREEALQKQIDALKAEGHDLSSDVKGLTENTTMNPEQAMEMALVMHKGRQGQPEREALEAERATQRARRDYKKGLRNPSPETRVDEEQALEAELAELETLGEGSERKTAWNRLRDGLNALFS